MFIFPSPHNQNVQELKVIFEQLDPYCHGYHIDVMDGTFVPATMGSVALTNEISQITKKPLWIHLMVTNPLLLLEQLSLRPGDTVSVHYTALEGNYDAFHQAATQQQLIPSLALNPNDSLEALFPLLKTFSNILIMAVQPGSAGQKFKPETLTTIHELMNYKAQQELSLTLAVDGGVTSSNIAKLKRLGISWTAVTSAIFNEPNPVEALQLLQKKVSSF